MKFHWTGSNCGAAVEFFMAVDGCIGVAFDDAGKLFARVGENMLHFERDTEIEFTERDK